jgi:ATP-dependent Lhr-like helicase
MLCSTVDSKSVHIIRCDLLGWLQGSAAGMSSGIVAGRSTQSFGTPGLDLKSTAPETDLQLDYVGSTVNAAKVIAELHRGEKRLVFADSKRLVEMLGAELRARGVTTHLVHASLSLDERRRAEEAFTVGRDCVIVSTSALELGIDVGDLDRVIQVNSPATVSAFAAHPRPAAARALPPGRAGGGAAMARVAAIAHPDRVGGGDRSVPR